MAAAGPVAAIPLAASVTTLGVASAVAVEPTRAGSRGPSQQHTERDDGAPVELLMVVVGVVVTVAARRVLGRAEGAPRLVTAPKKVRAPAAIRVSEVGEAGLRRPVPPRRGATLAGVRARDIRQVPLRADPALPTGLKVLRAAAGRAAAPPQTSEAQVVPEFADQPINGGRRENSLTPAA